MKKLVLFVVALIIAGSLFLPKQASAQAPNAFKYQTVVRDANGYVIAGQSVSFQISLLSGSPSGNVEYRERHFISTNDFGLVNITIGEGNVITGDIAMIDWSSNTFFMQTELDQTGGTDFTIMGTAQLLSVPYALHANTAGNTFSGSYNDLADQPSIPINISELINDTGYITDPTDNDADPTNEYQILSISNDSIYLSNGGVVKLPEQTTIWQYNGDSIFFMNSVGIGTTAPHQSAILELSSSDQGLLLPRMTIEQIHAIESPAEGLYAYDLTENMPIYYDGSYWMYCNGLNSLDMDNDGILVDDDNCVDVYNPDQLDMDNDSIGNACDDDIDGDGYINTDDNCPEIYNPGQEDSDNDSIGDVCDNCIVGMSCDDGNPCTINDMIQPSCDCAGVQKDCDDGDPCTIDYCDSGTGDCKNEIMPGSPCDDGDPCTYNDQCNGSGCVGTPKNCDDGDECTVDSCDPITGECLHEIIPGSACDDGDPCTMNDVCDGSGCAGTPMFCDDGDPCTVDECDGMGGCTFTIMAGSPCDDGDPCTNNDECTGSGCVGIPTDCSYLDSDCTIGQCDGAGGCISVPRGNGTACDDGDPCTVNDGCIDGVCTGTPLDCSSLDSDCTIGQCDGAGGCISVPINDGFACSDGDPCTFNDACNGGVCTGTQNNCDDGDPCTIDYCVDGVCHNDIAAGSPCDDGDACTINDVCTGSGCVGTPVNCDDGDPCTIDFCDPGMGCVHVNDCK